MLFNSLEFAIFFPVVTVLFFLLPHRYRWFLLLMASCFFYMFFKPVYIFILIFTIIIDYFAGIWIAREPDRKKKKLLLLLSIAANVGVLAVFKYYNFIANNLNALLPWVRGGEGIPLLNILLPIGLSFHTFQAMSYTIEIYRGHQQPEKHFGIYALYVMFYPQLVAGPIERPQNIIHQFHEEKKMNYGNIRSGLILIAWGLFKKVVIADRLALFVNHVYANPHDYKGLPLILATLFFAFQIFCDFSGYSDIAIGSARCMGFVLMRNFDRPYMSQSVGEFWRRWHISLSTWFRDYVYIPLGGSKVSKWRWYLNIMIVFVLSGIWHGANWTFAVWGVLHGFFLVFEQVIGRYSKRKNRTNNLFKAIFNRAYVLALVTIAWVFFRANNISTAFYIVRNFFTGVPGQIRQIIHNENFLRLKLLYMNQSAADFCVAVISLCVMAIVHFSQKEKDFDQWLSLKPSYVRWPIYYGLVLTFICLGIFDKSGFIYFQF